MKKKSFLHSSIGLVLTATYGLILVSCSHTPIKNAQNYPVGTHNESGKPIDRMSPKTYEPFASNGWNAGNTRGQYTPGLDTSLPKSFKFTQFQGPHSFKPETSIVRLGQYSAKLHWKHDNPEQWNGDPSKLDNSDKKAMFHGKNASSNKAKTWYGFSVYFPSQHTKFSGRDKSLFFQLHGGRDRNGEPNRVPPLALLLKEDAFQVDYSWDANERSTSTRGQGQESFDVPVVMSDYKDRWVDVVIQVRSDPFEENGFVKMWFNGKQLVDLSNIQIGYNDKNGLYPSYGWYTAKRAHDLIMYLDEIRHVESDDANYFDVAPGFFEGKTGKAIQEK